MLATSFLVGPAAWANKKPDTGAVGSLTGAYLAAKIAEDDNDTASAIEYYRRALDFDPDDAELQGSLMQSLVVSGRLEEAIPLAEKLQTVEKAERISRLILAVEAIRKDDYKKADGFLRSAKETDLDRLIATLMGAWVQAGQKDVDGAFVRLKGLKGSGIFQFFGWYHRALIADASGKNEDAAVAYQAAVDDMTSAQEAPQTWMRAVEGYASFLARRGEKDKALEVIAKADSATTGSINLSVLRERIEQGKTLPPLATTPAQGASEVLLNLGSALNRNEPFATFYLQLALALRSDSDAVLMELASAAEQQQNGEAAIGFYSRVSDESPWKRGASLQQALNLADLKRYDEAIVQLKKLIEGDPNDMRGYLSLGSVYAAKEDFKPAAETYDKAIEHLPNPVRGDWNIFYRRGIAYERLKEWPKAEPNFRKALELYPDQPQVLNYLGYSWVDMNINLNEGLDMIRKAVDLRPSDGYIVDSLGWAYYRLNRFEEATTELERAVSLQPDDPVLNDHLGDAYWRVGRKLEATFQWRHARDLKPEPDVLAGAEKKLKEGLPPLEDKAAAQEAPAQPEPKKDADTKG